MKVNLTSENPALKSIFNDPKQIVTLDANFLIIYAIIKVIHQKPKR